MRASSSLARKTLARALCENRYGEVPAVRLRQAAHMTMRNARFTLVLVGLSLPYTARLPRGIEWLQQYSDIGLAGS